MTTAISVPPEREPTADDRAGMAWWNSLTEDSRAEWLRLAGSAAPVDAWRAYKASKGEP